MVESNTKDIDGITKAKRTTTESEFISDKFKTTDKRALDEVQENMIKLGLSVDDDERRKVAAATGEEIETFFKAKFTKGRTTKQR